MSGQNTTTDELRLAAIEARLDAATPGPWRPVGVPYDGTSDPTVETDYGMYICQTVYDMQSWSQHHHIDVDTALIAAAPDDLRWLVARVRALEAENAAPQNRLSTQEYSVECPFCGKVYTKINNEVCPACHNFYPEV